MKQVKKLKDRNSERGSAGSKFVITMLVLFLIGHAGYNYIPVAYQAASFKQEMETAVLKGVTLPKNYGKPAHVIKEMLTKAVQSNQMPDDTYVEVIEKNNVITARVYYEQQVAILPFGIYDYLYIFDHSATPKGFFDE